MSGDGLKSSIVSGSAVVFRFDDEYRLSESMVLIFVL